MLNGFVDPPARKRSGGWTLCKCGFSLEQCPLTHFSFPHLSLSGSFLPTRGRHNYPPEGKNAAGAPPSNHQCHVRCCNLQDK
eukprot:NODE_887_length_567_cov_247.822727_g877_i0.p1 GENE.NODE_887_length_567_cov_247.822727_g877_i0~~NODE_887_length_567_cov_247.822727_g877_i0.p1  ORF type:complete len:82 (+),score=4.76 NODE_887_length_567_cov_247.822727_g877_i0:182-427(+)